MHNVPTLEEDPLLSCATTRPEALPGRPGYSALISKAVGGLPLAIELLGDIWMQSTILNGFCWWNLCDPGQAALQKLTDPTHRLQLASERLGAPGVEITLKQTIALSLEGLQELARGKEAQRTFCSLGAFAPKPALFSREAAEAVSGSDGTILAILVARNLLEVQEKHLTLHQTLADVARNEMSKEAVIRHRNFYLNLVNEDRDAWQRIEAVIEQIKWALAVCPEDEELLDFIWAIRTFQERRGLWRDNIEWAERGLELTRTKGWREAEGACSITSVVYTIA